MIIKQTDEYQRWFHKLKDYIARAAIARRMESIDLNNHLGDYKVINDSILELRIHCGAGYRIYCTLREDEIVLLLCGGNKTSQKADIERAKKLAKEV